jgi:hypothetical protein
MTRIVSLLSLLLLIHCSSYAQISTFPHLTDFESEALGGTGCGNAYNFAGPWRNADQYGLPAANLDWNPINVATPSSPTGPDADHTTGSGKYIYLESSCSGTGFPSRTVELVSDYYDFSASLAPSIGIWYHMYGSTMGTMHLDVDTTRGTGAWINDIVPAWTDNLNQWQEKIVGLFTFAGMDSVRLRIRGISGTNFYSDMAVDDIRVFNLPSFDAQVLSIQAGGGCGNSPQTQMIITYTNFGAMPIPAGDTLIFWGQAGASSFADTLILTQAILPGDTVSYAFVNGTADLSGPTFVSLNAALLWSNDANASNDSATNSAIGVPVISSFPYVEDFEQGRAGWLENAGTNGTWAYGQPAKSIINGASSGQNCFVNGGLTGSYNDSEKSWVESPCFDFSNLCSPGISLRVFWNAEFSWDGMNITATTDGGATWVAIGAFGDPYNWYTDNTINGQPGGFDSGWSGRQTTSNGSNAWVTARHTLLSLAGQPSVRFRINFGSDGSVTDEGVAFDDIRIYDIADLGEDMTVCAAAVTTLEAGDGSPSLYTWSTGATTSSITVTQSGTYTVTVSASPTCVTTESITVVVVDSNTAVGLGVDTAVCAQALLDAGYWPGSSILWSDGSTSQTLQATTSGAYSVEVSTPCGILADTIVLNILPTPSINLGPDVAACDTAVLQGPGGLSGYLWSDGQTQSSTFTLTSGLFWLEGTAANGCSARDSILVTVSPSPQPQLAPLVLCNGLPGTLDAGAGAAAYLWSTGATTQAITVSQASSYSVTITDLQGCTGSTSLAVPAGTTPVSQFSGTAGAGGLAWSFSDASTGTPTAWSYSFGDGGSATTAAPTHTYAQAGAYTVTLIVTNACGADTSTQTLLVVGRAEAQGIDRLQVYPQPNDGHAWLVLPDAAIGQLQLSVWDMSGRLVRTLDLSGRGHVQIDLSGLSAGSYQLRLQADAGVWQGRTWLE